MIKVSIIVPVYNVEKYLDECLSSILSQNFTEFECILVNDGSTDNSQLICENYKKKDSRVIVLNQNNCGATKARFNGVKISKGKWIMFVDSDDTLNVNSLTLLLGNSKDVDIVIGQTKLCPPVFTWPYISTNENYDRLTYLRKLITNKIHGGPCARIIKKSLFNDFVFDIPKSVISGEDFIMNIRLCLNLTSVKTIDKTVYNYRYLDNDYKQNVFSFFQRMVVEIKSIINLEISFLHQISFTFLTILTFFRRIIRSIIKKLI